MRMVRILAIGLLAAAAACSRDTDGVLVNSDPVGGLRYVNLVSDTGAMDFRIIDIVGDAPNTVAATFRTGGLVFGNVNPSPTQPPYQPVRAGARHIRIFMSGTTAAVATTQMFDTTFTFDAGQNYTFFLYGTARTGTAGRCCSVLITKDSVPTLAAGKFAVRVLNLAPTYAGASTAPANGAPLDVRIAATNAAVPTAAASAATVGVVTNQGLATPSAYISLDTTGTAAASVPAYKLVAAAAGTTSPAVLQAILPLGVRGSSTSNPFAGTSVAGTAITAVILPRSTPASTAPQTAAATVSTGIDSVIRSADTVTVVRSLVAGNGTSTCTTATAAGVSANDVLTVSGVVEPEYNGAVTVLSVTAGTSQTVVASPFSCTGTAVRSRFRYRIAGTPATPATGTPSFKVVTTLGDFTAPSAIFLFDRQPARTAP